MTNEATKRVAALKRQRTLLRRKRSSRTVQEPCNRCGGEGGSQAWSHTGWKCFRCGGSPRSRVWETVTRRFWPEGMEAEAQLEAQLTHDILDIENAERERVNRELRDARLLAAHEEALAEDAERVAAGSCGRIPQWIGEPGERIEFTGTVTKALTLDGFYGPSRLVIIETPELATVVTIGTGNVLWELDRGDEISARATVAEHETRDGVLQTKVKRLTLIA